MIILDVKTKESNSVGLVEYVNYGKLPYTYLSFPLIKNKINVRNPWENTWKYM